MQELSNKRVAISGPDSMIGRALFSSLYNRGNNIDCLQHTNFHDLSLWEDCLRTFSYIKADYYFHLAAYNGNIKFNAQYPCDIFERTALLGLNCLQAAYTCGVKKTCSLISSCAYPPELPLKEANFFAGKPHDSVEAHGFAKKLLVEYGRQIKKQHGMDCINVVVNHVYGPYDNFDPNKTKVVGSLIKKFSDAKKNNDKFVELWGNGQARREFIYVDDVAKYLPIIFENYNDSFEVINLGCGQDYSILDLAHLICDLIGYNGKIKWLGGDDGQKRKLLDNTKITNLLGPLEFIPLDEGIWKTIDWFKKNET